MSSHHQYTTLNFGDLEPTRMIIQLANRSVVQLISSSNNQGPSGSITPVTVHINLRSSSGDRQRDQNSENTYIIENEIQTQGLDLVISSSMTIAMADGDDPPLLARTSRIRSAGVRWCSNRSPLVTFDFSVPSLHFLNREKCH
ncbi:hypothetical protein CR513_56173, partial [Mucuna pruriens]